MQLNIDLVSMFLRLSSEKWGAHICNTELFVCFTDQYHILIKE